LPEKYFDITRKKHINVTKYDERKVVGSEQRYKINWVGVGF